MRFFLIFICLLSAFPHPVSAGGGQKAPLPLPRFAAFKSDEVFMRTGPAQRYPIKWTYKRDRLPVEILQEFDGWRRVRDFDGEEGWVHQSMLSGKRTALISGDKELPLFGKPDAQESDIIARVEPKVIVQLEKCDAALCRVRGGGFKGWMKRDNLWGIYPHEIIE